MKIAIYGPMCSGKTTVADIIKELNPDYEIYSFGKKIKDIAKELFKSIHTNAKIDWHHSEMARAKIRVAVKRILKKYGYPPNLELEAIQTVLQQAEAFSEKWAA